MYWISYQLHSDAQIQRHFVPQLHNVTIYSSIHLYCNIFNKTINSFEYQFKFSCQQVFTSNHMNEINVQSEQQIEISCRLDNSVNTLYINLNYGNVETGPI